MSLKQDADKIIKRLRMGQRPTFREQYVLLQRQEELLADLNSLNAILRMRHPPIDDRKESPS